MASMETTGDDVFPAEGSQVPKNCSDSFPCEGAALPAVPAARGRSPYITVQFEDGPAPGLLADTCEDDFCDPRYWKFEELHERRPLAKVLYPDGDISFMGEWPNTSEGEFLDHDGDAHRYVCEEQAPLLEIDINAAAIVPSHATVPSDCRQAPGGYGHFVVKPFSKDDDINLAASDAGHGKEKRSEKDEDWTPGNRRRKTPSQREHMSSKRQRSIVSETETKGMAILPLCDVAAEGTCVESESGVERHQSLTEACDEAHASVMSMEVRDTAMLSSEAS